MATGHDIVDTARGWIGTPFHHQGRKPGVGLDCVGLLVCAARAHGLPVVDSTAYGRRPRPGVLLGYLRENCVEVPVDVARKTVGAVLLFHFISKAWPQHAGLVTDRGILHAYGDVGRVVEHPLSDELASAMHSGWAFKGIA